MLATELIKGLGIEVQALSFKTPFFSPSKALQSAGALGITIKIIDITEKHLDLVKRPRHGYGENMNPCIDCHTLMIRTAGEMLGSEEAQFIITGEVLGQRPMSQNRKALSIIDEESGFKGLILRPLSARHLPPSRPEEEGWVDRGRLMDFSGRTRKPQMALAKEFGIRDYPSPAGGCLLTDRIFSMRLRDLFSSRAQVQIREIELLKLGRHFRISPETKVVVGRNMSENNAIQALALEEDLLLYTVSVPGPTVLVTGETGEGIQELAAEMTLSYSDAGESRREKVILRTKGRDRILQASARDKKEYRQYMI